jgi:hypothetical protein
LRDLCGRVSLWEQSLELRFERLERRIDRMVIRLRTINVGIAQSLCGALRRWPPH